jgi:hypothetical protein
MTTDKPGRGFPRLARATTQPYTSGSSGATPHLSPITPTQSQRSIRNRLTASVLRKARRQYLTLLQLDLRAHRDLAA